MQSQPSSLGPGMAGLIIQGIESGLVLSQFSQWLYTSNRSESSLLSTVVVFVTVMGLCASFAQFYIRRHAHYLFPEARSQGHALRWLGQHTYDILGSSYVFPLFPRR